MSDSTGTSRHSGLVGWVAHGLAIRYQGVLDRGGPLNVGLVASLSVNSGVAYYQYGVTLTLRHFLPRLR